ncbi:hypothetical protein CC80DRAFT_496520 [Byssothecium circinans]|uniref:RING-type domain-containing protein n=1 Tax=Byssothecium circinans TaxID=147558 RepID=A0A6A5TF84_9PLEO|nr:hypothetical protein CC80DRAFT_496520 [Byssothecium circinans]
MSAPEVFVVHKPPDPLNEMSITPVRPCPEYCEYPTFPCTNRALIYDTTLAGWFCDYCTSWNASTSHPCCREDCGLIGDSVDIYTGNWFCPQHRHRCDALVPRPPQSPWPVAFLRCPQRGLYLNTTGRYFCFHHFEQLSSDEESVRVRPEFPRQRSRARVRAQTTMPAVPDPPASSPTMEELMSLDLEVFATVVETDECDCPICYEVSSSMRRLLACGHLLCDECLRKMVFYRVFSCPLDRRPMTDLP